MPDPAHRESRFIDFDLLVLLIVGTITLLAAGYTLLPVVLGAESTQQEENIAGGATEEPQPEATAPLEETAPTSAPQGWVIAIGDSVMVGAVDALEQQVTDLALLDAQGSRQPQTAIDILRKRRSAGQLGDVVIVHIGNNGPFTDAQFDEMMQALAGMRKVLIVNLTVPPHVEDPIAVPNNAVLAKGVQRYPNGVLVDWRAASANHPEYFGDDGIHLTLEGAQAYADLIAADLGGAESPVEPPEPLQRFYWGEGGSFGVCVGPSSWCMSP